MGGGLTGNTQTKTEIPGFLKDAAVGLLDRALAQSNTGYMPYAGPSVAAMPQAHSAAMNNQNEAAAAFGLQGMTSSLPGAQDFGGGMWGYSGMPAYDAQMEWMRANRPGQLAHYESFTIDPVTGLPRDRTWQGMPQPQPMQVVYQNEPRTGLERMTARQRRLAEGDPAGAGTTTGSRRSDSGGAPMMAPGVNPYGYVSVEDMINGGGPGRSGSRFEGGGVLSTVANASRFNPRGY